MNLPKNIHFNGINAMRKTAIITKEKRPAITKYNNMLVNSYLGFNFKAI